MIDTHCHLAHKRLREQTEEVLSRAQALGVSPVICAAANIPESQTALEIAEQYPEVFCIAGVHPHEAAEPGEDYLRTLEQLAACEKNVAIGETGLDYHYDFSPRGDQRRVFAEQLELAYRLGKPIVVHTREAFDDTIAILTESGVDGSRVVFHSCTEGPAGVRRMLDFGAMVSFSGIVTFKKTDELRLSAALVPDDRILIETDSPYLSPEPVRKMKTNEPANVIHVAQKLAQVRNTTPQALATLTTANTIRFFRLNFADE